MFTAAFPDMKVTGMRGTRGKDGVTPSVYASWLQKAIRRGLFHQALYAAAGLYSFSLEERGAPLATFLLNRIEIISMEDIGLANPFLTDAVLEKVEHVRNNSGDPVQKFNVLAGVIKALCESQKTRLSSWLKNAMGRERPPRDLGGFGHIQHIFCLEPSEIKKQKIGKDSTVLSKWLYKSGTSAKKEWIYGLILALIRPQTGEVPTIEPFDTVPFFAKWVQEPEVLEGTLKDIVLDIHTGKKKKSTESRYDFAIRGAHVENEKVFCPHLKEFYNECKKTGRDGCYPFVKKKYLCKDSQLFVPTSQLIGFKTPTLFVKAINDENFFAKLMYPGTGDFAIQCHLFRSRLGLFTKKSIIFREVLMTYKYEDLAQESSRTASERTIGALKTKCSNIVDVLMVQKVEGGTTLCEAIRAGAPVKLLDLMKVLLFRRYVESTDTNSNNIVVDSEGNCLSVDENPAEQVQYTRWSKLENPDTVFTAQKNANFPDVFVKKVKAFSVEHEAELVAFLEHMKRTKFSMHRNESWLDRMLVNKNWF